MTSQIHNRLTQTKEKISPENGNYDGYRTKRMECEERLKENKIQKM